MVQINHNGSQPQNTLPKSVSRTPKIQSGCNKANELENGSGVENVNYSVTTLYLNSYITEHCNER